MSERTGIEWTDATWNPVRGCSRVSEGCRNCYAEKVAGRFSGPGMPYEGFAVGNPQDYHSERGTPRTNGTWRWTGKVALVEKHLLDPLRWRKPRRIFVNSMSDLFHEALPDEAIDRVFAVMALAPRHCFQLLTKRAMRMWMYGTAHFGGAASRATSVAGKVSRLCGERGLPFRAVRWPLPNVWLGVSVEDQATADERIPLLLQTPAALRWLSLEPLLEDLGTLDLRGISWVVCGGESGPGARPCDVAWIRSIVAQCKAAGVKCFVKQLGARPFDLDHYAEGPHAGLVLRDRKGGDPAEWPEDLRVREFPEMSR